MDRIASVLLDFPPAAGLADDAQYHAAAQSHSHKVEKLMSTPEFEQCAHQLVDVCYEERRIF